ncbi:MAG: hypothetical protein KAY55_00945 [Deltaproteobacteria bacterium]|nr:hypothetical protein [Deltaproteobacteria bacterium]
MLPNLRVGIPGLFLVALWGLLVSVPAQASPLTLVLGLQREGQSSSRARSVVVQHLLRMGEPVLSPSLSSVELLCTERACLQRLGRAYSAHRLLGGEIFPNDRSFLVRLWLYDLDNEQPLLVEERCTECTEELLLESVSRAAGRLVDAVAASAPPSAPASTPTVAPGPVATTGPAPAIAPPPPPAPATSLDLEPEGRPRCVPRQYSFKRGVFAGALSALGLVGLASAIALSAKDGEVYLPADGDAYPTDLLNDFGRTARSLYGVSALGILGGAAAFAPWERWTQRGLPACPERPQGRWTFRRGLAVGAFGSLTVAGLIVSSTMAGLDGKTWGFNQIGTPVPYQLQTATQAGFGATVGMGVGLALSLLIP